MKYEIISIDKLRPLEQVFPTHLRNLEKMINTDGFMLKAIISDIKTGTILDGSHRYVYLLKNGYKEAPVYWVDYDNEDIRVGTHLKHRFFIDGSSGISKQECRERALSGNLFPPRTTRHFFTFRKADISLPLTQLKQGLPVDVSSLIYDADISEEIRHNRKYIKEINEEVESIIKYLSEVSETKKYLTDQIKKMDEMREIAFFPGKFHPPHIGHIQTILNFLPKYKKVIIGVSEDMPEDALSTPDAVVRMLKSFFKGFDKIKVCQIKGVLVKRTDTIGLPDFDVLLSGNEVVLDWAKKMGIKCEYVGRSVGVKCNSTAIRRLLKDE